MEKKTRDIIIVGAGLTGLTLAYYLKKAGIDVLIIEKQNKIGGVIQTVSENGFTYETGPSTGVIGTIEIADLFEDLQGKCEVEIAEKSAEKRFILKNGEWKALPHSLFSAIATPLFTWYDKFRILGEPFRKRGTNPNESIAEMVKRRLGNSYLDYAVDPFISGVYAGNPEKLITRFALPKLYTLEQNYGSFIYGSIKKTKEPKLPGTEKVTRKVFSIKGGLSKLTEALAKEIGEENILLKCNDTQVSLSENLYSVEFVDIQGEKQQLQSSKIISTVGAFELTELFPFLPSEKMAAIANTNYADVVQIAVGFNNWNDKPLEGFGGLIPSKEKRDILGVLFPSAIFKNRTPKNGALMSVFVGGSRNPEMMDKTDVELKNMVIKNLNSTFGKILSPDFIQLFKHKNAIAQYDILSEERLKAIQSLENEFKGLFLAGSIRDGIGMADRVKQAKNIVALLTKK